MPSGFSRNGVQSISSALRGTPGPAVAFAAYRNAALTITLNADVKIDLDTEQFDTHGWFASGRFTPKLAGYYAVSGSLLFSSSGASWVGVWKNGAEYTRGTHFNTNGLGNSVSTVVYLNGGADYVELYGRAGNSGALNVSSADYVRMSGMLVAAWPV